MKRKFLIIMIALIVIAGAAFGANLLIESSKYLSTNNASLGAPLVSVSSMATGQIISVNVNIGDRVEKQQSIAEVGTPRFSDSNSRQGFDATPSSSAPVQAPVSGYIAAVWTYPGAITSPGVPIVTIFDDSSIWVTANIDENKIRNISPGQVVDVKVDCLGGVTLKGKVIGISPATASTFSLLPQNNSSASFTKVAQVVPVRITLDNPAGLALIPGSSVEVNIRIK